MTKQIMNGSKISTINIDDKEYPILPPVYISMEKMGGERDRSIKLDLEPNSFALTWQNINVKAPEVKSGFLSNIFNKNKSENQRKDIIQNVNGIAKPGEVMAIMGASGAGKTTLLNVLTFKNRGKLSVDGEIKINGQTIAQPQQLASISGYVQQNDIFLGTLKVIEHLRFQAMLRMESSKTQKEKFEKVEEIMNDLNLKKCQETLIGNASLGIKGISGGEMRRLAFASEIITNPAILFCDEPTSGLDSFMALSIVDAMRSLAQKGKTIICTIHQPSSEIFEMFDSLYLMAEGRVAYAGQLSSAMNFFEKLNYRCPANYNPADFYIKTLAIEPNNREICKQNVKKVCDAFDSSSLSTDMNQSIQSTMITQNGLKKSSSFIANNNSTSKKSYKASTLTQLWWLVWRSAISATRNPMEIRLALMQNTFIGIMFGLIFLQTSLDQDGVQNINSVLILLLMNASFSNMFVVLNSFPAEMPIFLREHGNGMYRVINYYLSKFIIDLPKFIFFPTLFCSIVYWMVGLNSEFEKFLLCLLTIILAANCAVAFGTFLSAAAPDVNTALGLSAPLLLPLMIFSGFFLNNDTVPVYFIWLKYISWLGYGNEILVVNQWRDIVDIPCPDTGLNSSRCFTNGKQVIATFSMNEDYFVRDFLLMGALILAWRVIAFLVLLLKAHLKNR